MAEKNEGFWQRVDELRGRLTVREMAERTGISEQTLQTTRATKAQPKFQMAYPIAKLLGTTLEYLYTGEREEWDDIVVFRKISSSQQLFDIAEALCHAEPWEVEAVARMLNIQKNTPTSTASVIA